MSFIFTFDVTSAVATDVANVNSNGTNTVYANSVNLFFIDGRGTLNSGLRSLPRNPPDCIILDSRIFDNFISFEELFPEALQGSANCLLVNNRLCGKLVLSMSIMYNDNLTVISVVSFVAEFNLSN